MNEVNLLARFRWQRFLVLASMNLIYYRHFSTGHLYEWLMDRADFKACFAVSLSGLFPRYFSRETRLNHFDSACQAYTYTFRVVRCNSGCPVKTWYPS